MTDYAVRRMLLLRKRLYNLYKDVEQLHETLCPYDEREIGGIVKHCAETCRLLYYEICEATRGYSWGSKKDRVEYE